MPGIIAAQVRAAIFDDEPPHTLAWPRIGKAELNHDAALARKFVELHETPHVPHQKAGIELTGLQPAADPARTPVTERHHDRPQLLAGRGQPVFIGARASDALDDADLLELAQPLREQRRRHAWHATADVVEPCAAAQQLAHDQRRPAFAKNLGTARDRAELSVVQHAMKPRAATMARQVQIID